MPTEEIIRTGIGALLLAGFLSAVYFAARRYLGNQGKTPGSAGAAAIEILLLVVLVWSRRALEEFVTREAGLFDRFTHLLPPDWPEQAAVGLVRMVMVAIGLVLVLQIVGRLYWNAEARLRRWHAAQEGLTAHAGVFLTTVLSFFRYASVVVLVVLSLRAVLGFFPRTRILVDQAEGFLATPAQQIGTEVVEYLPNLGYLIIFVLLGYYLLKGFKYVFTSLENGTMTIRGFPPEWAIPTYRLARTLLLLFLLMVTFPYLPGAKSQFFQGFSVFVGALITLGSSSTIGNVVAGTVLTYTRAFRVGDMVTIGDRLGIVVEKNLLVTRLLTPNNEEVSIPNGNVLSTSVLNYSARAKEGLVLSVKAGIGYDMDWRKVHELMIEGARATKYIVADPAPQVFQAALGDYAVSYELRAFTNEAVAMVQTLSSLRANVLDAFNRAGVEIMTPTILAHRDASRLAVPKEQFHDTKKACGIAVDVRSDGSISTSI